MPKKCPSCATETDAPICPSCGMLSEEQDPETGHVKSDDDVFVRLREEADQENV